MSIKIPAGYKLPPGTVERTRMFLQQQTDTFGTFVSKDRILYHMGHFNIAMKKAERELRPMCGAGPNTNLTPAFILGVLSETYGVPDYKMLNKDGNVSMDKSVRQSLIADAEISPSARRIAELFESYNLNKYMVGYLTQYLSNGNDCVSPDFEGNRMLLCRPTWNILSTSRFSASNPSVQNIKREIQDIFTAPKGYQLVHSDSGQIEPRITYSAYIKDEVIKQLIILYDDAYFGLLHYILMTPDERLAARRDPSILHTNPVTDDMKAKRKRLKVLGLAGNYGSQNLAAVDPELGPLYEEMIVNHPARREWEREVTDQVRMGTDHFYAYFGTPVYPDASKSAEAKKGSSGWKNHVIRCGINNPIQTTASELMHISLLNVMDNLHYDEHIAGYIHDAGMFYVPEDKVEERAPVFQQLLAYDVEGWIPIGSDLHIGREESGFAEPIF